MTCRTILASARADAGALWRTLEERLDDPPLACSWAWTETWLDAYGDAVGHRFVVGEVDGEARAIALVTRAPAGPARPRTLHLGTAGEPHGETVFVERNRLLAAPDERAAFAAALMRELDGERGWDRLRLDGLLPDDAAELLVDRPGATLRFEDSPVAELQAGDDVLDALSGSRRQRARRSLKAFGELELEWAETAEQAVAILDELIDLHQAGWERRGERGAFASARLTAFHRALVARLVPEGRAALVRVRRGDETVGCLYGLIEGRRLLFYQGGLRHYDDNKLRAGQVAHVLFMRACREHGLDEYDFLAPAARYKEELATRVDRLVWAEIERPSWRTSLSRLHRRLERDA
jgi:CelD/BcsL family acetyltransferase involved in cellulose biosynthesis